MPITGELSRPGILIGKPSARTEIEGGHTSSPRSNRRRRRLVLCAGRSRKSEQAGSHYYQLPYSAQCLLKVLSRGSDESRLSLSSQLVALAGQELPVSALLLPDLEGADPDVVGLAVGFG